MEFSIPGVEVNPFIPFLVAFGISFFTSMGGISGAFLLLPFQVSVLNFTSPAVSSTNHLFNVIAIPGGIIRYIKEGRMVWPLVLIVIIGTMPGVLIGTLIRIQYLPDPVKFKIFAGTVLMYIAVRLLFDLLKKSGKDTKSAEEQFQKLAKEFRQQKSSEDLPRIFIKKFGVTSLEYDFYGQRYKLRSIGIIFISFIVGIVGGIYGIGGGVFLATIFVGIYKLPVYTIAGAALMGTFITSLIAVVFYMSLAPFFPGISVEPNWLLGFLFGAGGFLGMYAGARMQKFVPPKIIKWILLICILFVASKYLSLLFSL